LFLALLLGAGVLGARPQAALAGDKIEFSWSSEKALAMPAVVHPDENPVDLSFGRSSVGPVVDFADLPAPPPVTFVPFKSGSRLDGRNGSFDSFFGIRQGDGSLGNADGRTEDGWNSSNPGTNLNSVQRSRDFSSAYGADDRDLGYGQASSRLDSADPYARRDRLNDPASVRSGEKDWTGRADSTYSKVLGYQRTSVFDFLGQKQARFSPTDFYNPAGASGDMGAYGEPSAPAVDPGAGNRADLHSSPGGDDLADQRSSSRSEAGDRNPIPYERAWDTQSTHDPISQQNPKPQNVPLSQGQAAAQQHPPRLSFPMRPGSVFGGF